MEKKPNVFKSFLVIIILVILAILGGMWAKKHPMTPSTQQAQGQAQPTAADLAKVTSPLKQIQKEGTGDSAVLGDTVTVNYVGMLPDGKVFDTNVASVATQAGLDQTGKTYTPFSFTVGTTDVISGWNVAVTGMKKGEVSQVLIPASYAYGDQGYGSVIPPNSPLFFQIEVVDVQKAAPVVVPKTETTKTPEKTTPKKK